MRSKTPVLCIVAPGSGYGKTSLIEGILEDLREVGIVCCVLKHSGHSLEPDAGKDTQRFRRAGALGSGVLADDGLAFFCISSSLDGSIAFLETLGPDLILCEGFKDSRLPKIVILREAEEFGVLPSIDGVLAVVFDGDVPYGTRLPVLRSDGREVTQFLLSFLKESVGASR